MRYQVGDAVPLGMVGALFAAAAFCAGLTGKRTVLRYPNEYTGARLAITGVVGGLVLLVTGSAAAARDAFSDAPIYRSMLDVGGDYAVRVRGEDHVWTAETVSRLQHAVRGNSQDHYRAFAQIVNEQNERLLTIREHVPSQGGRGSRPQAGAFGRS